ncbi:hypothetical protein [Oleidesulfovibrio sp.]|uniref:hypothetical protein n=1 Tax=Oleidesulfovibrio sp. TaxID=2909707 RepID=UPI003A8C7D39
MQHQTRLHSIITVFFATITGICIFANAQIFASENIHTQKKSGVRIGTSGNGTIIERNERGDLIMKTKPQPRKQAQNATNQILIITPEIKIPIK